MKTFVTAMAALLLTAGAAAAQPLSEAQLDSVSAGSRFTASAYADATGTVGPFQWVATNTRTTAQVEVLPSTYTPLPVWASYSASSSSTYTGHL